MIYIRNIQYPSIINYTIFGERHSGTRFVTKILHSHLDINYTEEYGHKHWFGFADTKKLIRSPRTLFVCMVRDPYDWIHGFINEPFHVPKKNLKSIDGFISKEWFSVMENNFNQEILEDRNYFTGLRYKNIFEMRKFKMFYLRHILTNLIDNCIIIQYESLIKDYVSILNHLSEYFSINLKNMDKLQNKPILKEPYPMRQDIIETITKSIDWDIEYHIGYTKKLA